MKSGGQSRNSRQKVGVKRRMDHVLEKVGVNWPPEHDSSAVPVSHDEYILCKSWLNVSYKRMEREHLLGQFT